MGDLHFIFVALVFVVIFGSVSSFPEKLARGSLFDEQNSGDPTAQEASMVTKPNVIISSLEVESSPPAASAIPIQVTSHPLPLTKNVSPQDSPSDKEQEEDSSDSSWKIAVGVVVPLIILAVIVAFIAYYCYRKKFPVRMIIGRDFGKFSNPDYSTSSRGHSLVRPDADDYFSNCAEVTASTADLSVEYNPIDNRLTYDNAAFVRDDDDDEDEKERKYWEKKAWLFKKGEDTTIDSTDGEEVNSGKHKRGQSSGSTDTDVSELLAEQKLTPKIKPRTKSIGISLSRESSLSSIDIQGEDCIKRVDSSNASIVSLRSKDNLREIDTETDRKKLEEEEDLYLRTSKLLFVKMDYDQVCAEVKARSRSSSVNIEGQPLQPARPRSYSVDPLKSVRKNTLYDEIMSVVNARKSEELKNTSSADDVGPAPIVTASVVGVAYRDKSASMVSSEFDQNDDEDDILEELDPKIRERCLSVDSINSNPDLVTDLDASVRDIDQTFSIHKSQYSDIETLGDIEASIPQDDPQYHLADEVLKTTKVLVKQRAYSLETDNSLLKERGRRSRSLNDCLQDNNELSIDPNSGLDFTSPLNLPNTLGQSIASMSSSESISTKQHHTYENITLTQTGFFQIRSSQYDEGCNSNRKIIIEEKQNDTVEISVPEDITSQLNEQLMEIGESVFERHTEDTEVITSDRQCFTEPVEVTYSEKQIILPLSSAMSENDSYHGSAENSTSGESGDDQSYSFVNVDSENRALIVKQSEDKDGNTRGNKSGSDESFEVLPFEDSPQQESVDTPIPPIPGNFPVELSDINEGRDGETKLPAGRIIPEMTFSDNSSISSETEVISPVLHFGHREASGSEQIPRPKVPLSEALTKSFDISSDEEEEEIDNDKLDDVDVSDISDSSSSNSSGARPSMDRPKTTIALSSEVYTFKEDTSEDDDVDV